MQPTPRFVGIDVSKAHLDVASRPDGLEVRLPNSPAGIASLVGQLSASPPALVLLEATGGLERAAAVALAEAGLPTRIVDPARVRHFARSIGQHSKTDALDARVLAHFAEAVRPEARELPDEQTRDLQALLDRRRQLVAMRVSEQNRLKQTSTVAVKADLKAHITYLSDQVEPMDRSIGERIEAKTEWKLRDEVLRSVPGIGPQTSRALLGLLPELGQLTGKQVSALAGLAPRARDSGSVKGARTILRWPCRGPHGVVYGLRLRGAVQPRFAVILQASEGGRQSAQSRPDGGVAKTPDDRQRDDPRHEALDA
ncbi:IS110 family transposase [Isosphaeraceae bacterium EP7]